MGRAFCLWRFDSRPQSYQVGGQFAYLFVSEIPPWLDRIWLQGLRVAEPRFNPRRRQPITRIVQVGTNVTARGPNGMAGLTLVLHFVEFLAFRCHGGRERPGIHAFWIKLRFLDR